MRENGNILSQRRQAANVAHKVQPYIKLFVALELVFNVLGFILSENSCGQYEQEVDLPATNIGFPAGGGDCPAQEHWLSCYPEENVIPMQAYAGTAGVKGS